MNSNILMRLSTKHFFLKMLFLFDDNLILINGTVNRLQVGLNVLHGLCEQISMKIINDKINFMVFVDGGAIHSNEK